MCSASQSSPNNSDSRSSTPTASAIFVIRAGFALTADGIHYIVETKVLEDTSVANKDAQLWCENTTRLAGKPWAYLKVLQTEYKKLQATRFEDLVVLAPTTLL
jgi:hypothetical protein